MHTRDYIAFAKMFAGEMANDARTLDEDQAIRNIIRSTADIFAQDNSLFDRAMFYEACGIGKDGFQ